MTETRRVCVVTGTRAEYGLLYWTLKGLAESPKFDLQLVVTGMHLSPEFGNTVRTIEQDGFQVTERVEILLSSDSPIGTSKAIGLGLISFSEVFQRLDPDIVLLAGDRFETFAGATAAAVGGFPIAHCAGGERTEGSVDDAFRHSITKLSHLHFVATDESKSRVVQLGESPGSVFVVGALGVENIHRLDLLDRIGLEAAIGRQLLQLNLLITYHPDTLNPSTTPQGFRELLDALGKLEDTLLLFTKSNADAGGRVIGTMIDDFVASRRESAVAVTSMGQVEYLSAMALVDGVVGNSSSGIIEAASLRTGTVNVGDRQRGRLAPTSVINCAEDSHAISEALTRLFSPEFAEIVEDVVNPYDGGLPSEEIVKMLEGQDLSRIRLKGFHDLEVSEP